MATVSGAQLHDILTQDGTHFSNLPISDNVMDLRGGAFKRLSHMHPHEVKEQVLNGYHIESHLWQLNRPFLEIPRILRHFPYVYLNQLLP